MPTDVLPLKVARRYVPPVREAPDPAVAALPRLTLLRDTLRRAGRVPGLLENRRFPPAPVFFFHPSDEPEPHAPDPWTQAAKRDPAAVRAWTDLFPVAADVLPALGNDAAVRHAARAVPGLGDFANALAPHHPAAREVADMLAVADDVTVLAVAPMLGAGFRVRVRGVADVAQFHVLFADAVTGNPANGHLPGKRPAPAAVEAYRDGDPLDPPIARPRFQFYRPSALRPDGTLPRGFSGVDDWVWGHEWVSRLPQHLGERVVLVGEPAFPAEWEAVRRVPRVAGELTVTEVLSDAEVRAWVAIQTGQPNAARRSTRRAA